MTKLYETTVINTGGRSGEVYSPDRSFQYKVAAPNLKVKDATNPEQLFAAGYGACFNSAVEFVMKEEKISQPCTLNVTVSLYQEPDAGFYIGAVIEGHIENVDLATAQRILEKAHQVCPYSKATRGNIKVTIKAV